MTKKVQVNGNTVVEISLKALFKQIWFGVAKLTSIWLVHMILRKQLVIATNLLRKFSKSSRKFTAAADGHSTRKAMSGNMILSTAWWTHLDQSG